MTPSTNHPDALREAVEAIIRRANDDCLMAEIDENDTQTIIENAADLILAKLQPTGGVGDQGVGASGADSAAIATAPIGERQAGWRDISVAPKDGTRVDLWCKARGLARAGRVTDCWHSMGLWWRDDEYGDDQARSEVRDATHWQPVPAPPESRAADGGEAAAPGNSGRAPKTPPAIPPKERVR